MAKNFWIALVILSGFFAGGFAMAEDDDQTAGAAEPGAARWWVIALENAPVICGQTSNGQFLCLHPEPRAVSAAQSSALVPAAVKKLERATRLYPFRTI